MGNQINRTVNTELLVVGGSGAAVTAAVYATRKNVKVLLVSKGKAGFSGNVIMAGGGMGIDGETGKNELHIDYADPSFTKEMLYDCIIKESFYLAEQDIVRQFVDAAPVVLKDYLDWAKKAGSKFLPIQPCGWQAAGSHFAKALGQGLKETPEIEILEDTAVVELLKTDGRVTGAVAIEIYTGEIIQINAKCVVLATGGYQLQSLKNTTTDMTGDGQGMAYRAGAILSDMEFSLAFPTALVPENMRGSIYPYLFRRIPHVIVDKGGKEEYIPPEILALSRESKLNKLTNCYYMGNIVAQGRGGPHGGAFWDYSKATRKEKEQAFGEFYRRYSTWHKYGYYKGEDMHQVEEMVMNNIPLEIGLGVEYSMGGVAVNDKMETNVPGLLCAGEVTAGTFGACRVADGLMEMLCQGMQAGLTGAAFCRANTQADNDPAQAEKIARKLTAFFSNSGEEALELYAKIERSCDAGLGVIRCEAGLQQTLDELQEWKHLSQNTRVSCKSRAYNFEWLRAIQLENLLICAESSVRAALERRESRGCHMRSDYEEVNHDAYLHHYQFRQDGDIMKMSAKQPRVIDKALPHGKKKNVLYYFADPELKYHRSFQVSSLKEDRKS